MAQCFINIENPKGFFYPREVIAGHVTAILNEAAKMQKVTLKFIGGSAVRWLGNDREFHGNNEVYFINGLVLMEPKTPEKYVNFQAGEFRFPFQFQLPPNLPPSTSISVPKNMVKANVEYLMKTEISVNNKMTTASTAFQVVSSPKDFEEIRDLLEPTSLTEEKNFGCLCCRSGPLRLSANIQKQIYYVGEKIVFSVEVDNRETEKELGIIEAKLKPVFTFTSDSGDTWVDFGKNESSVRLAENMAPCSEKRWNDVTLDIPTHITPSFDDSGCINMSYLFTVKIGTGFASDLRVVFPITVSSRPPNMVQQASQPFPGAILPPSTTDGQPSMIRLPTSSNNPTVSYTPQKYCPPIVTQQPTLKQSSKTLV